MISKVTPSGIATEMLLIISLELRMKCVLRCQFETAILFTNNQMELYPSQPLLYLVNGTANRQLNNLDLAIENLSMGLDYIYDNKKLQHDFYKQLSTAFRLKGNIEAAQTFTNKAMALENNQ